MQRKEIRPKKFFLWGLEGALIGGLIYFLILLLNDETPLILSRLSYNSSFIFAILLIFVISIFFGIVYAIIMLQLHSRNIITTDNFWKTLILGSLFGLIVYLVKEIALFSWYFGLPADTVIMGLIDIEKETWLEFIGNIAFGIISAVFFGTTYERYIKGFKLSTDQEELKQTD